MTACLPKHTSTRGPYEYPPSHSAVAGLRMAFVVLTLLTAWSVLVCPVHAQELVSLDTRPGVVQS